MHTLLNKVMQIVPDEPDLPLPMLLYSYEWAITHAKKYIWFQTPYFVPPEPVLDAMKIAALTGIDIRLMLFHSQASQQGILRRNPGSRCKVIPAPGSIHPLQDLRL